MPDDANDTPAVDDPSDGGAAVVADPTSDDTDQWRPLRQILAQEDPEALVAFIRLLDPSDVAYTIGRLDEAAQTQLFHQLAEADAELGADLLEHLADDHAADIIEELEPVSAAAIVEELDSADQVDVLGELDDADARAILDEMDPAEAAEAEARLVYDEDTAGGLMIDEVLIARVGMTVGDVIADIRHKAEEIDDEDYEVRYVYVLDEAEGSSVLRGVVGIRHLILAKPGRAITAVMKDELRTVLPGTGLEEIDDLLDHVGFGAVPVVERTGELLGVVQRSAVQEAVAERGEENLAKVGGIVGGEELRSMPVVARAMRRLVFLAGVAVLLFLSALVILQFEHVIEAVPAVAAFLPLVAGICGSGGGQAVAVSMRELSLGLVREKDVGYVVLKEVSVAGINGVVLGVLLFALVALVQRDEESLRLGVTIGAAAALVLPLATAVGGAAPLVLKRVGWDPAMLSVPMVTTIVDLTSFLSVLVLTWVLFLA